MSLRRRQGKDLTMIGGGKSAYPQIFVHRDPRALGKRDGSRVHKS